MNKRLFEEMKGKSREERAAIIEKDGLNLSTEDLNAVNGGVAEVENPNSDICPYKGNWISSWGYVCEGEEVC